MRGIKKSNEYMAAIDPYFYAKIPKAVLASIAVSLLVNHEISDFKNVTKALSDEWAILNLNGIVPQKPVKI